MNCMSGVSRLFSIFVGIVLLTTLFSGCDFDDDTGNITLLPCESKADCTGAQECIGGYCTVPSGTTPDAGSDVDGGSTRDAAPGGFGDLDGSDSDSGDGGESDGGEGDVEPVCNSGITCDSRGVECGAIANGCGGLIDCGGCPDGAFCGQGAERGQCVEIPCRPGGSCEIQGRQCGSISDNCGGAVPCGTCPDGEFCSAGNDPGQCLEPAPCVPIENCDGTGFECGTIPDGCGGVVTCGSGVCPEGKYCGAGAARGTCLDVVCTLKTCADYGNPACGPYPDGCGGAINCGSCPGQTVCGVGAERGQCVQSPCVPKTCADYNNVNCGPMPDGCGGATANCGTCVAPEICGGSGVPNVCGAESRGAGCENLCLDQAICAAGGATTIRGTVYAPNGTLPIPNAVVYVPNVPLDQLPSITSGATCERCEDEDLGSPLVGAISNFDGTFELRHVPAGVEFPLVIKVGKWRRVVMIPPRRACGVSTLVAEQTRLPKAQNEDSIHDNIPRTAISTGRVDAIECVLFKLGVNRDEFSRRDESGRIHLYRANGGTADAQLAADCNAVNCTQNRCTDRDQSACGTDTRGQRLRANLSNNLYRNQALLDSYDMLAFDCEASNHTSSRTNNDKTRMLNYVNKGGRVFASHFAFDWLHQTDELRTVATWGGSHPNERQTLAFVDVSFGRGQVMWNWLQLVGADHPIPGPAGEPQISINEPRYFVRAVDATKATRWVHTVAGSTGHVGIDAIQQFSFDTPVGAAAGDACGRVVYSAFHVDEVSVGAGQAFPTYCAGTELSPQEKMLAFMLFDLAACVSDDGDPPPPVCTARTCADVGAQCGVTSNGCGGLTPNCGTCPDGTTCGGGGVPNVCGGACTPLTCAEQGAQCGTVADGCGGTVSCGPCPEGAVCGGGGVPNVCSCTALTCADHEAQCGEVSDGCGGALQCGNCPDGVVCGAAGIPNRCNDLCVTLTCADHGAECGNVSNGCGGTLNCGPCADGQICGGGGVRNVCGGACEPLSCEDHGAECSSVSDGCGGSLDCGECTFLQTCEQLQCVDLPCVSTGESCIDSRQCCSQLCAIGSGQTTGVCITN